VAVVLPYTRVGVIGGIMLGLVGLWARPWPSPSSLETPRCSLSLFMAGNTISSTLANELPRPSRRSIRRRYSRWVGSLRADSDRAHRRALDADEDASARGERT